MFLVDQQLSANLGTLADINGMTTVTLHNANWSWELDTGVVGSRR
ncbi:MAG: hypothetical protein ACR2PS_07720 [Pseudomonadales bacterium]